MYAKSRSNNRLTRDSQPLPTKQTLSLFGAPSSRAPRNFFVDSSAANEKRSLAHICRAILHKNVSLSPLQFPDSLQKRSPGCSQTIPVL